MTYSVVTYATNHQLEKIIAVAATLTACYFQSKILPVNFYPEEFFCTAEYKMRVRYQLCALKLAFRHLFPIEVLAVIADYSPALIFKKEISIY
jgi:hypothetical protein